MLFREFIQAKSNVLITARERGKRVPRLCRHSHNVWVNIGRQYLAEVISPKDSGFSAHYSDPVGDVKVTRYIGLGIGSDEQTVSTIPVLYPTLESHYPGQNTFDDDGLACLQINTLERPVKVTGTAGTGTAPGVWMKSVAAPPTFSGTPIHIVTFTALFSETDLHLGGSYPAVPLSECGLMLSDQYASRLSNQVYDYSHPPDYIASTRQTLIAYNGFATITKTAQVTLEINWEITF